MLYSQVLVLARKHELEPGRKIDELATDLQVHIVPLDNRPGLAGEIVLEHGAPGPRYTVKVNQDLPDEERDLVIALCLSHTVLHPHLVDTYLPVMRNLESGLGEDADKWARNKAHRLLRKPFSSVNGADAERMKTLLLGYMQSLTAEPASTEATDVEPV